MSMAPPHHNPPGSAPQPRLLDRLPWGKALIWGLILLALYTLRHLFFIIFMTFLFSFIIRTVVVTVASRISPHRERPWLERGLTLAAFVVMLTGVAFAFRYIGPKIYEQGRALVMRMQGTDPLEAIRDLRSRTVGAYLLRRRLGQPGDEAYDQAFERHRQEGRLGMGYFKGFASLRDDLQTRFDGTEAGRRLLQREKTAGTFAAPADFDAWFLEHRAPRLLQENRTYYEERWSEAYAQEHGAAALLRLTEEDPDWRTRMDDQIKRGLILQELKDNPREHSGAIDEWKQSTVSRRLQERLASPEYEAAFGEFYEAHRAEQPRSYPFDFETFKKLNAASADERRFLELIAAHAVGQRDDDPEVLARDFRLTEQATLAEEWWNEDPVAEWIQTQLSEDLPKWFNRLRQWVQTVIGYAATLPIELATALILSIFITFDVPRLRQGVHRLHRTRLKDIYEEIAPGLVAFARLIGRAFEAQAVIAMFNTLLTFAVLWFLAIENAIFLCTIVFLCSFIPILGVILSSVPIALMAILQPGGSLWLAVQAVIGIIIIHFIETSILNPKILGDMLHLHPVMVLAILLIGEHFFGIWGLLLGVPVGVFIFRLVLLREQIPGITDRPAALPEASPSRLGVAPAPQAP
jgi:predicted PurR-regulated permease PerM